MSSQRFNKYIGLPFALGGRDKQYDCYGLVRLFYREELGIDLPEYSLYKQFDRNHLNELIDGGLLAQGFCLVESPKIGDLGLYKFQAMPTHLAVYIGDNKILHTMIGVDSIIERTDAFRLKGRFFGWYRKEN